MLTPTLDRRSLLQAGTAVAATSFIAAPARTATRVDPMTPIPIPTQVPSREGVAQVAGTKLFYRDTGGMGQPVVLLHPATGSALIWSYQQPVFVRAGYRVIAYSRRGYNGSDAVDKSNPGTPSGDLAALTDYLKLGKFHLLGSAAGGGIAVDYALSHPDRLHSLVVACAVGGVEDESYLKLTSEIRPKGFDDLPAEFRELGPSYRAANPEGTKIWAELESKAVTGNRFGPRNANKITFAKLATLTVPTLVMAGDADLAVPPSVARAYAEHIPRADVVIVPECGHSAYWERPDIFNRAVLDFFSKHRG
ncbi:MAG TPA: alpha/beta hydrolase [Micropepsaceae bacterium]|nr:alpha/beta hydrolase [Micropepsaceae bacterium]